MEMKGTLRLGALESICKTRLCGREEELRGILDGSVKIGSSASLFRNLMEGALDAVFVIDGPNEPGLERIPAYREEAMLIYPADHVPVESPYDLADIPFVGFAPGCAYRKRVLGWLSDGGVEPSGEIIADDFADMISLIAAGAGFACVPSSILSKSGLITEVQADRLPAPYEAVTVDLIWRSEADAAAVGSLRKLLAI